MTEYKNKFKIGDKVIPLTKTVWGSLDESNCWRRANENNQGFLYVNRFESNGDILCSDNKDGGGDFFKISDLIPYTEENHTQELINKLGVLINEAQLIVDSLKIPQEVKPVVTTTRQQIINEAKEFVEKYRSVKSGEKSHSVGNETAQYHYYNTDLITKGRKTTAIVYLLNNGKIRIKKPQHIGRSICAPDDVFNKYIGEAIALGRALEINVDKFINAVQPTEFVEGQVVKGNEEGSSYYSKNKTFTLIKKGREHDTKTFYYKENKEDYIFVHQLGEITDDTDAQYGESVK